MTDARDLAIRLFDVIDGKRYDEYETVLHPDVTMTSPFGVNHSAREWAEFSEAFTVGFPDGKHTITQVIQSGHRAAIEGVWTGTHTGPMATPQGEVPPTGARVELRFCGIVVERDGRLEQATVYLDQLTMLAQLGLVPQPAA